MLNLEQQGCMGHFNGDMGATPSHTGHAGHPHWLMQSKDFKSSGGFASTFSVVEAKVLTHFGGRADRADIPLHYERLRSSCHCDLHGTRSVSPYCLSHRDFSAEKSWCPERHHTAHWSLCGR